MPATFSNPAHSPDPMHPVLIHPEHESGDFRVASFPPVPTLLATRLQLQLLLCGHSVDLRAASGIILNDVGATLEIFRLAGQECGGEEAGTVATRVEDCLASLGTDAWMDAVCANAVERVAADTWQLAKLLAFWENSRLLAYACSVVAEHSDGVCPEEAYLVGLLHGASHLPELLGWNLHSDVYSCRSVQLSFSLASHCYLPSYLRSVLAGPATLPPHWRSLLDVAHAWSRGEGCILSCTA